MHDRNQHHLFGSETLTSVFESAVDAHGDRTALVDEKTSLSFRELDERANGIALAVVNKMKRPGERACALTKRSLEATVMFLGLCKSGAVDVRLNPRRPIAYLRSIIDDAEPRLIVTDREHETLAQHLHQEGMDIIYLDDCSGSSKRLERYPDPAERTSISYTSGTTGRPKGVVQNHRSALSFVKNYVSRTGIGSDDKVALLHDARGMDLHSALTVGATSFCFPLEQMGFNGLAEWLIEKEITILPTMPSLLRGMLRSFASHRDDFKLRLLRLSGEVLKPEDVRQVAEVLPINCRVVNWFGSTEVAVASGCYTLDELARMSTIPVGPAFENADVKILEPDSRAETEGLAGEIVTSSSALFEGYWKQPELDRKKFFVDPEKPGQRCFRTGDVGYLDAHGRLVVVGRVDSQIKVNGHRVERAEVEAALRTVPGIHDALVRLVQDPKSTPEPVEVLAAYIVSGSDPPPLVGEVRRRLAQRVPRYMIPTYFCLIDELPRLDGGKPDRKRLPDVVPITRRDYNPTTETSNLTR